MGGTQQLPTDSTTSPPVDYAALAKKYGAVSSAAGTTPSQGAPTVDYAALAKEHGAISSTAKQPTVQSAPEDNEPKGFWHGVGSEIGTQLEGLKGSITAPWHAAEAAYSQLRDAGMSPVKAIAAAGIIGLDKSPVGMDADGMIQGIQDWQRRKADGYGVPYRVVAALGQQLGMVNPTAMEEAAKRGDTAGIYGHALTDVGEALAGAGVSEALKAKAAAAAAKSSELRTGPLNAAERALVNNSLVKKLTGAGPLSPEEAARVPEVGEFQPALAHSPAEVLQHAHDIGVDLTPGQATQRPLARTIQGVGERALWGSDKLAASLDANSGRLLRDVRSLADEADPKQLGVNDETAGAAIKQNVETGLSVARENSNYAYKEAEAAQADLAGDVTGLKDWAEAQRNVRQPHAALTRPVYQEPAAAAALDDIADAPARVGKSPSIQSLRNLRTEFQSKAYDYSGNIPDAARRLYSIAADKVDDAIADAARGTNFEEKFRDASSQWKTLKSKYDQAGEPLTQILQTTDPAKITQRLLGRASVKDIELLKQEGMTGAVEALRRKVIGDVVRAGFGVNADGLAGYSDPFLRSLFEPDQLKRLYLDANLGRRFRYQLNPSGTSNALLGESQLVRPEPSKLGAFKAAATVSMPRDPLEFLPKGSVPLSELTNAPGGAAKGGGFKPRAFAGGPESGTVPLRSLVGKKSAGEYNENLPAHFITSDGKISSFREHNVAGGATAIAREMNKKGTLRVSSPGAWSGLSTLTVEAQRMPTDEQFASIAKMMKDANADTIYYDGPSAKGKGRDGLEFRSIGEFRRYFEKTPR